MRPRSACRRSALPQSHDVALRILEVAERTHARYGRARRHRRPAGRLDLRQGSFDVLDIDGDDGERIAFIAARQATVDRTGFRWGHGLFVHRGGCGARVMASGGNLYGGELGAENVAVERLGAIEVCLLY